MKRILVLGSPGSGKTTFALELSMVLGLPCIHLDKLFWKSGWEMRSRDEFDAMLLTELEKENWIIDGNYSMTIGTRADYADTAIFFDYPRLLCLYRVIKRVVTNYGKTRADMGENCPERFDFEFLKYVWRFKYDEMPKCMEKLEGKNINLIVVKNKREFKKLKKSIFYMK